MNYTLKELNTELVVELNLPMPPKGSKRAFEGVFRALCNRHEVEVRTEMQKAFISAMPKTLAGLNTKARETVLAWQDKTHKALDDVYIKIGPMFNPECQGWRWALDLIKPENGLIPTHARIVYLKEGWGINRALPTYQAMLEAIADDKEKTRLREEAEAVRKASLAYRYGGLLEDELRKAKSIRNDSAEVRQLRRNIFNAEDVFVAADNEKTGLTLFVIEKIQALGFVRSAKALRAELSGFQCQSSL